MWTAWPETTKPQVRECLTCGSARGQGRGRTADLPVFRRTLVPTELHARADETLQQRHGGAGIGRSRPRLVPGGRWRRVYSVAWIRAVDSLCGGGSAWCTQKWPVGRRACCSPTSLVSSREEPRCQSQRHEQ